MEPILFESPKKFILLDYSPSHSELIIRHIGRNGDCNIDLFFKGVDYINIVRELEGLSITEVDKDQYFKEQKLKIQQDYEKKLFCLTSFDNQRFFIKSYWFAVFENRQSMLTSPLGDFLWSKENNQIYIVPD